VQVTPFDPPSQKTVCLKRPEMPGKPSGHSSLILFIVLFAARCYADRYIRMVCRKSVCLSASYRRKSVKSRSKYRRRPKL